MDKNVVLQWNCNGLYSHIEELKLIISENRPLIICIQETLLKQNQHFYLSGYSIYRTDGESLNRARGGVLICVRNDIHSEEVIINNCHLELVCVKVYYPVELTICNFYLPPDLSIHLNILDNVKQQLAGHIIFLGDFNAHNPLWGSLTANNRGLIIENFKEKHDLLMLNSNSPTHFNAYNGST